MRTVTSKDGTRIAYDKAGQGPAVVLVDGALCYRAFGPMGGLAALLAPDFTVFTYDRRGRGESGDTKPYAVQREVEDIEAIIEAAGGSAFVYAISSGAALAIEAAMQPGTLIQKLALYEPAYNADTGDRKLWQEYTIQLDQALTANRRGDAAAAFMMLVGMPQEQLEGMRQAPVWSVFEAIAPTLAYDAAILGEEDRAAPVTRVESISVPTLVMNGSASYPFMHDTAVALVQHIPNAQHRVLNGQTHDVAADAIVPELKAFFQ